MTIESLRVREIFDSRGESTIEVSLNNGDRRTFRAEVPSGRSRGSKEAAVLPITKLRSAEKILKRAISGKDFKSVGELDRLMIKVDGTANKSRLGGNLILGTSIAFTRALAFERKQEVWQTLQKEFFRGKINAKQPLIFSNLINGGEHADNNLDIQEYMVVVRGSSPGATVKKIISFYKTLGAALKKRYKTPLLPIGDEGGYSTNFKNNFEPIVILERLIKDLGLKNDFSIGLDAAASSFYSKGRYLFDGHKMYSDELSRLYMKYFRTCKLLLSIEDPFYEEDYGGFELVNSALRGKIVVGDDLTVTSQRLIESNARAGLINAVIIKPNQIGTVSEACQAMNTASRNGLRCIVSHRSGETEDIFIIHLARAGGVFGLKIGAPTRERILKFNEFVRVYSN